MDIPFSPTMKNFPYTSTAQYEYDINFDDMLYQDMAIRRFCPERMDQESGWNGTLLEVEISSSLDFSNSLPCDEDSSFFDSIIDTSQCEEEVLDTNDEDGRNSKDSTPDPSSINKGLELVHSLLASAEAVGFRDTALATSALSHSWTLASPNGDSLQRVSFYFAMGLKSRLYLLQNVGVSGSLGPVIKENINPIVTKNEKMDAFHHLYQTTPYIAFGFMAANNAICGASKGKDYLHIVDLGMSHTLQWLNLIETLSSRPEVPPRIKITGITTSDTSKTELESNMHFLIYEARKINMHVEFQVINEQLSPSLLTTDKLGLREGEELFFNSIMHLHCYVKESRSSLKAILTAINKLKPKLFSIVEQDANHNRPFFLARFLESLHFYSAMFDSLEASLPRSSSQRTKIEMYYLGEEIRNIVACEGGERVERHERADQWRRQLGRAGFQGVGIDSFSEAKMLVSGYGCDGYTIGSEKGCFLLGWKGRTIIWASAWQVNSTP